jgi:hypothetical protein
MDVKELSVKSVKTVREKITQARWTVESFTSRIRGEEEDWGGIRSDHFSSLEPAVDCEFWLGFDDNDLDMLQVSGYTLELSYILESQKFNCTTWIENENGDKLFESQCK